jgi:ABC-type microcin C transport system duplicated ATPase subunit YejF
MKKIRTKWKMKVYLFLCMNYLMTPSLAQMILVGSNGRMMENNELQSIWKEVVVTYVRYEYYPGIYWWGRGH